MTKIRRDEAGRRFHAIFPRNSRGQERPGSCSSGSCVADNTCTDAPSVPAESLRAIVWQYEGWRCEYWTDPGQPGGTVRLMAGATLVVERPVRGLEEMRWFGDYWHEVIAGPESEVLWNSHGRSSDRDHRRVH